MKSLFIGFDLGSHASKGVIIDGNGFILASETLKHGTDIVNPGWQEQIPTVWWEEFKQICDVLLKKLCRTVSYRCCRDNRFCSGSGIDGQEE